jgi:D-alanyl-D-alanine carboxypeptidase
MYLSWSLSLHLAGRLLALLVLLLVPTGLARATPMLLVDMTNAQVLYEDDAGVAWHPASLTKMMTAYVAFEAIAQGRVSLDTPVIISKNAINQAPSKSGLKVGAAISMKDALYIMLVKSANDVAVAIAETVSGSTKAFVGEMNSTAAELGMTGSYFVNPNGLHADDQVMTARDMAVLALFIRQNHPQYLPIFGTESVQLGKAKLESNNELLLHFAGTTGMKTGFVCASGLNIVATVERDGRQLLAVTLGASSARERNELTAQLVLRALSGQLGGQGKTVLDIANRAGAPTNMRSLICGKEAKAYVAEREAEFPMGMKGQPSYLTDQIDGLVYRATDLGQLRNVPLPRPRPDSLIGGLRPPLQPVANLGAITLR